jgi:hypothetical protein
MGNEALTIIAFVITLLTWFGITPVLMYKTIRNQKILKFERFDFLLLALTVVAMIEILYYKITNTGVIWNYVHLSFMAIYPWLIKVGFAYLVQGKFIKAFNGVLILSSILLQTYSIPSINLVINGEHDNEYILKAWIILGFVIFGWFMAGVNIGFVTLFFKYFERFKNLITQIESKQLELKKLEKQMKSKFHKRQLLN